MHFYKHRKNSSWRVGRVVPIIRSAVLTTLCSLLRSDLVAELNQTVNDVQRTDSMLAEKNCFSSSCGRWNFLSWRRKYRLCWAFFTMDSMWLSHFRSWEIVVPRNLNDFTAVTLLFMMVTGGRARGGGGGGVLLKSMIISTVLSVLSSRLLRLHQTASSLTSCLYADSSPSLMKPISVASSADFRSLTEGSLDVQLLVYREKSSGERTQPWGAPVLIVRVLDESFSSLTSCYLTVRKLVIHWQTEVGTENCVSLFWRVYGMMVLKAELKSTNRILT